MELTFNKTVNPANLTAALIAALSGIFEGCSTGPGDLLRVHLIDGATTEQQAQAAAIVDAHDPAELTEQQQIEQVAREAGLALKAMLANRIQWHEENPVTQANAGQVLSRLQVEVLHILRYFLNDLN